MQKRPFLEWQETETERCRCASTPVDRLRHRLYPDINTLELSGRGDSVLNTRNEGNGWRKHLPFARKYSDLDMSSMTSRASASSRAKACSSSYSPGRPRRSSIIRPRWVYLKKKKTVRMMMATAAEPKAESTPIRTPFPVESE